MAIMKSNTEPISESMTDNDWQKPNCIACFCFHDQVKQFQKMFSCYVLQDFRQDCVLLSITSSQNKHLGFKWETEVISKIVFLSNVDLLE